MALKLIANYSKRLGLPGFSSHQFSVCVETEISSINEVAYESTRLYETLQKSVDEEIQQTGFVPDAGYGMNGEPARSNGHARNGQHTPDKWGCSDKQRELILKLVSEHSLDRNEVDETSQEMFGVGVKELNKLQASGLIDMLLEDHGASNRRSVRPRPSTRHHANGGTR